MTEPQEYGGATEIRQATAIVSTRSAALLIALVAGATLACTLLNAEQPLSAAVKVVAATLVVGIAPGALATMLCAPRPQLTLIEVLGFGTAVSFGLVHLLTILAITAHLSPASVLVVLAIASVITAGIIVRRSPGAIAVSLDEAIVLALVAGLGVLLYRLGSPPFTFEDQVHVAIARRLSQLAAPSLDNIYFVPGVVYTYPFPGTHYFMGLVAKLADIDALFVYQKLRFFWGPAALVMLHLAARLVFGTRAVACAVTSTAVVLVCTGIFATVPGLSWGQLIPYSHASDVAMTVLLPTLLVTAFAYLEAGSRRERAFFFAAAFMLALMLTSVHIREMVQFFMYLGCFLAVTLFVARLRPYARRTTLLLVVTVLTAAIYTAWHARLDPFVAGIVHSQRERLISLFGSTPLPELLFSPISPPLADFVPYFDLIWTGLTPFFLFAGPTVVWLFRERPLVWLVASSTLAYLAILSMPALALSYIYLTYFEILFTPVRNIVFFVYLFAGAFLYVLVVGLTRIDRTRLAPLAAAVGVGIFALLTTLSVNRTGPGFFAPLLAAYGLTLVLAWGRPVMARINLHRAVAATVSLIALGAMWPDRPPEPRTEIVNVRWAAGLPDPRRTTLEEEFGLMNGTRTPEHSDEVNAWSYGLRDLSKNNIQALVTHPDVVDTHYIDRGSFTVPPHSRAESPFLGVQYAVWLQYPGWTLVIGTVLALLAVAFVIPNMLARSTAERVTSLLTAAFREPFYRHAPVFALCMPAFALWSAQPALSPLVAGLAMPDAGPTPRAVIEQNTCVTTPPVPAPLSKVLLPDAPLEVPERIACAADYNLIQWVSDHIPANAVFAINRWNPHLPPLLMPQQVVVSPSLGEPFLDEYRLFERYYRYYRESIRKYRVQPFFNDVETPAERVAFVEGLGVTHILVDPEYYTQMRNVLDRLSGQFELQYSGGQWAVYAVLPGYADRREGI